MTLHDNIIYLDMDKIHAPFENIFLMNHPAMILALFPITEMQKGKCYISCFLLCVLVTHLFVPRAKWPGRPGAVAVLVFGIRCLDPHSHLQT